jgi:uncharacterized surface anchored protein
VVFGIYRASDNAQTAELTTGADGTAVSGELPEGDYYLTELRGLDGYKVVTDKTGVTVKAGETAEITIYNALLPPPPPTTGYIRLIKKAEGTDEPLSGAVFGVYMVSGDVKVAELTTGADGKAVSGELPGGDYYLLEQTAPAGFSPITDKIGVTVNAGETAVVTVYNAQLPPPPPTTGYISLIKKAEGTNEPLSGAVFGVYTVSGDVKVEELITGADGKAISGELPGGDYYLLEQTAPAGFSPITDKIGVTVKAGEITEKTVYNAPWPVEPPPLPVTGYIRLIKKRREPARS